MESAVTAPVSGHVKRVVVHEGKQTLCCFKKDAPSDTHSRVGDSIAQGDLVVEIVH